MNKDELREMLEEVIQDPKKVDELMAILDLENETPEKWKEELEKNPARDIDILILNETDWRKRASLAAIKISTSLDK
jgi:hypothetical protein